MMLQLPFHGLDPVFLEIGPLQLRWYGLMYMVGFIVAYFIMKRVVHSGRVSIRTDDLYDLLFYLILGVMVGGRLGYVLLYDFGAYLEDPLSIFAIWQGGMSFHGGLVGTTLATVLVVRKRGWEFWKVADMIALAVPLGLGLGRVGNFINGELYGRESSLPWAMFFPAGGDVPRHPSQLYEALLEGLLLFFFVRWIYRRAFKPGAALWGLISGYGLARFFVEFVRSPDAHVGFDLGPLTRGQLLSFPMLLVGGFFLVGAIRSGPSEETTEARSNRQGKRRAKKK
jgi:phosphatidylglycerol:prolipoprotein diacylglycerol transferase